MGCDGGTIPRRDELVRTKKKPEQKDRAADLVAKWKHCSITQEPLRKPVMACELGRLYNKESALEFLIDRSKFECAANFQHLRGLKDLKELNLTENPAYRGAQSEKGDAYIDMQDAKYICPVVGLEMNGMHKFCFLWSCGCVLSERALKEVKAEMCHKCGKKFSGDDVLTLNGSEEEVQELRNKMEERRLQAKLEKKAKKSQKHKAETVTSSEAGPSSSKQMKTEPTTSTSKLTNGTTDFSSKVKTDSRPKVVNGKIDDRKGKNGSIQKDPTASSAYKSLFTTSDKAKNQQKAHWVTYNPCFY